MPLDVHGCTCATPYSEQGSSSPPPSDVNNGGTDSDLLARRPPLLDFLLEVATSMYPSLKCECRAAAFLDCQDFSFPAVRDTLSTAHTIRMYVGTVCALFFYHYFCLPLFLAVGPGLPFPFLNGPFIELHFTYTC